LVAALCSVEATLQGTSATPARRHRGTLHCNNHSSTGDSISSERQAFQVPSLHRVEEESSQAEHHEYTFKKLLQYIKLIINLSIMYSFNESQVMLKYSDFNYALNKQN